MPPARRPGPEDLTKLIAALTRQARRLTASREAAEDLAQEALLRVWARLEAGAEIEDLRAYLFATLRFLAKRPGVVVAEAIDIEEPPRAPGQVATQAVLDAIETLPPEQAVLLRAVAREGIGPRELALRMGLPPGTVMSRLARGRARLIRGFGLSRGAAVDELLDF